MGVKQTPENLGCRLSDISLGGATAAISVPITLSIKDVNLQPPSAHPQYCPPQAGTMGIYLVGNWACKAQHE